MASTLTNRRPNLLQSISSGAVALPAGAVVLAVISLVTTAARLDVSRGTLSLIYGLGTFFSLLAGSMSDVLGDRRKYILVSGCIMAICITTLPSCALLSQMCGAIAPTVVLTILAVSMNICLTAALARVAEVTTLGVSRSRGFAWMSLFCGLVWGSYAAVGSIPHTRNQACYTSAGVVFILTVLIPLLTNAKHADSDPCPLNRWAPNLDILLIGGAHLLACAGIGFASGCTVGDTVFGETDQRLLFTFVVLSSMLPILVLVPLSQIVGRGRAHAAYLLTVAVGYLTASRLPHSPLATIGLLILLGPTIYSWGGSIVLPLSILSEKVGKTKTGTVLGAFQLTWSVPFLILLATTNGDHLARRGPLLDSHLALPACAGALMLSAILWLLVTDRPPMSQDAVCRT